MTISKNKAKGFTLLELLIVIAILAILSVTLVLVLNPAESLRKSRDTQRMSDLLTLKTALGLYMTTISTPDLDAAATVCLNNGASTAQIAYSVPSAANVACATPPTPGADAAGIFAADWCYHVTSAAYTLTDGTGWLPVKLSDIVGGSPISNLPIDPTNTAATATPSSTATYVYRYACQNTGNSTKPSSVFEVNAVLESDAYKVGGTDDRSAKDGGDNADMYEVGTSLKLLPASGNF